MVSFKQFLAENEDTSLSVEEAAKFFIKNCSEWKSIDKPLYRVTDNSKSKKFMVRNTRERYNKSKGNTRDIQEYMFSQPGWEKYPDRLKSIFCSTENDTALGSPNVVIYPINGTPLAKVDYSDLNFKNIFDVIPKKDISELKHTTLRSFTNRLKDVMFFIFRISTSFTNDLSTKEVIDKIKKTFIKNGHFDEEANGDEEISNRFDDADLRTVEFIKIICKYIPDIFTPEKQGCTLESPSTINISGEPKEVWFSGKYLSIPINEFDEFKKAVKELKNDNI